MIYPVDSVIQPLNNWAMVDSVIHPLKNRMGTGEFEATDNPAMQICPGLKANEIQSPYDKHHKVSSVVKKVTKTHTILSDMQ